ncbi:hypothetical protein AVEN_163249-1 [Araneus ventricosus]|uniref:BTB domain-containing protein n=1 Tax=Araneus ventricosus TaxID=182803 RepID=A0A4Y2LIE4_ARAVE|nr:hypothetical protein AVEN_163249-1 [Araneus ventricosus]
MDFFGLKEQIQAEDHVMDLKIENFSAENNDPQERTFIPELFNGLYAFSVSVFPNGSCPIYAGYVSLLVKSSMTPNKDLNAMGSSNSMSCTASVVDVRGDGRCSQSFGIENLIFPDSYIPGLERFIRRSTLLSQEEELLPEDVLTMRFEFSFKSNQESAMLSKITEFLPSLFVEPLNLCASGMDNSATCDFYDIFKDIEEKSEDDACAKPFDNYMTHNQFQSVQTLSGGIHKVIGAGRSCGFEIHKENEDAQIVIKEIHAENENQILEGVIRTENGSSHSSGIGFQKDNADQTSGVGILKENEGNRTSGDETHKETEEIQTSRDESTKKEKELNKLYGDIIFNKHKISNKTSVVGEQRNEMQPTDMSESVEEKLRQLQQTGDETTKNIIIVVNGHRMFLKSNQSHRNRVDFSLTTDEELYKMFYSIDYLDDKECKSIYRMHGTVPFFKNLMDRDETAFFNVAKSEEGDLQRDTEGHGNALCPTGETDDTNKIPNDGEITDNKKLENLQYSCDEREHMSSRNFGFDSAETHIQSKNFTERSKSATASEKITDRIEARNEESPNEEENSKEHKFDFVIQTIDNVSILVPFEEHEETIGSKLLAASTVFENMPMKESTERRVELSDATSRTVNNLLSYVDSGKFPDIPLPDAYDLYEAADKYAMKNLMKECADFMAFFPIRENVWSMVKLAELHCDDYLLELAECVQKLVSRLEQTATKKKKGFMDMIEGLVKDKEVPLETRPTDPDFFAQDFNFYQ